MKYIDAMRVAQKLVALMKPHCERIEVAGSLRRQKQEVKDIEIVGIPKARTVPYLKNDQLSMLFPVESPEYDTRIESELHEWATKQTVVKWIKPGTKEIVPWEVKAEGKYWRGVVDCWDLGGPFTEAVAREVKLDLFLCRPENWGVIYLIRTGSADFSASFVTHVRDHTDYKVDGGELRFKSNSNLILCPEERDVFDFAGLEYVVPRLRRSGRDVRVSGSPAPADWRNGIV